MINTNKRYHIGVLGRMYTITFANGNEDESIKDNDGYCDATVAKICISKMEYSNSGDNDRQIRKTIRHEVIHAFMFESGLAENWEHKDIGIEETTVDWFAHQMPKIIKVLDEAGLGECLKDDSYLWRTANAEAAESKKLAAELEKRLKEVNNNV